jgi:hypothetical protein
MNGRGEGGRSRLSLSRYVAFLSRGGFGSSLKMAEIFDSCCEALRQKIGRFRGGLSLKI